MRRLLMSVDLSWRGMDYRLNESVRNNGCTVRPSGEHRQCLFCPRRFRAETTCICLPDGSGPLCIPCGIRTAILVPVGKSERTERGEW